MIYSYIVSVIIGGGIINSSVIIVIIFESFLEDIFKFVLIVKSVYSILVEWSEFGQINGNIISYFVMVNGIEYNVGFSMIKLIIGLNFFIVYFVCVKVCIVKGCGFGDWEYVIIYEVLLIGQGELMLVFQEWNVVQIFWLLLSFFNGIIICYEVYWKIGVGVFFLVCFIFKLICLNIGFQGYMEYFYRVRVRNGVGFVDGFWKSVCIFEGFFQGINLLFLNVFNFIVVNVFWIVLFQFNGVVMYYEVCYCEEL